MRNKYLLKICISIALFVIAGFVGTTFAADTLTPKAIEDLQTAARTIQGLVSILSRARIFFADIAGKLLTNSRVYGTNIGMDSYLWTVRHMVRNISNYILGFIFLFFLFRTLFYQEEAASVIKNIILRLLIAGIGIQASWFLVAATLDLSTIGVAAVGSLPAQIITTNPNFADSIKFGGLLNDLKQNPSTNADWQIDKRYVFNLFPKETSESDSVIFIQYETEQLTEPLEPSYFHDYIFPRPDSVAGPLIFIGASIIGNTRVDAADLTQPLGAVMKIGIDGFGILLYGIAMILLAVVAFIRIVYLWLFIVLSPIIVLIASLGDKLPGSQEITKGLESAGLSLGSFFKLAFKPVIIVLGIGVVLLFSVLLNKIITDKTMKAESFELIQGTFVNTKQTSSDTSTTNIKYQTTIDNNTFHIIFTEMSKGLGQILLTAITLVFIRFILKIALSTDTGIKFLDNTMKKATQRGEDRLKDIPIVPLAGGLSANDISNRKGTGLLDRGIAATTTALNTRSSENEEKLQNALGRGTEEFNKKESYELEQATQRIFDANDSMKFVNSSKTISQEGGKRVGLANPQWTKYFINWLNAVKTIRLPEGDIRTFVNKRTQGGDENTLQTFLNTPDNLQLYRKIFDGKGTPPTSYHNAKNRKNFEN